MAWFYLALATAVCWGMGYVLTEKVVHAGISSSILMFMICILGIPVYLTIAAYTGSLEKSVSIFQNNHKLLIYTIICALIFVFGNMMIFMSVALKNATYANIIEITYPIFTILFTWLLFKEFHLTWSSIIGTLMIFSGVVLILYKS